MDKFRITLKSIYFEHGDIIGISKNGQFKIVADSPPVKVHPWYKKVLWILSLGFTFKPEYIYEVDYVTPVLKY